MKINERWVANSGSSDCSWTIHLERDLSVVVARNLWKADAEEIVVSHNALQEVQ